MTTHTVQNNIISRKSSLHHAIKTQERDGIARMECSQYGVLKGRVGFIWLLVHGSRRVTGPFSWDVKCSLVAAMSKVSGETLREGITTVLEGSKEKQRKFKETIELQVFALLRGCLICLHTLQRSPISRITGMKSDHSFCRLDCDAMVMMLRGGADSCPKQLCGPSMRL